MKRRGIFARKRGSLNKEVRKGYFREEGPAGKGKRSWKGKEKRAGKKGDRKGEKRN